MLAVCCRRNRGNLKIKRVRIGATGQLKSLFETATNVCVGIRGYDQEVLVDFFPVKVFIKKKLTPVHFKKFCSRCFDDDACSSEILIGFIGNDSRFGTPHGDIADVRRSAPQVADFSRECRAVMIMDPGLIEQ